MYNKKTAHFDLQHIFLYMLWIISFFFRRKKNQWLFGSGNGFNGSNTKFFFLYMLDMHPEIRCYWITDDKQILRELRERNLPVKYKWSPSTIWLCLTSKVYVFTHGVGDINFSTSGNTLKVSLWHGIGIKNSQFLAEWKNINENSLKIRILKPYIHTKPDLYLTSYSPTVHEMHKKTFRIGDNILMEGMYPRVIPLISSKQDVWKFIEKNESHEFVDFIHTLQTYDKVYIYMPTYRHDSKFGVIESSGMNLKELNDFFIKKNYLLLLKLHPWDCSDIKGTDSLKNVKVYDKRFDIYLSLPFIDTLITDYSSVFHEFILMDKEIILFNFDYDDFIKKDNGLYFDYKKYTPAIEARTYNELKDIIFNQKDCKVTHRDWIVNEMWGNYGSPQIQNEIIYNNIKSKLKR